MKRKLHLTGNILGIISPAVLIFICLIQLIVVGTANPANYFDYSATLNTAITAMCIYSVIGTVTIVLSSISLKAWKSDKLYFKKLKGTTIAAIVFDFIMSFFTFIEFVSSIGFMIIILLSLFSCSTIAGIFLIVDLASENGKWEAIEKKNSQAVKINTQAQPEKIVIEEKVDNKNINLLEKSDNQKTNSEEKIDIFESMERLEKLADLKAKGAISQSEFEEMKKEILGNVIKTTPKTTQKSAIKTTQSTTAKTKSAAENKRTTSSRNSAKK